MFMVVLTMCMSMNQVCVVSVVARRGCYIPYVLVGIDFFFVYWIQVRVTLEEKCQRRNCLHQIACRQDCSAFSWRMTDVGGPTSFSDYRVFRTGMKSSHPTRGCTAMEESRGCAPYFSAYYTQLSGTVGSATLARVVLGCIRKQNEQAIGQVCLDFPQW